jgi:hypothetical protein
MYFIHHYHNYLFLLVVLGFELRASQLLGRHSTTLPVSYHNYLNPQNSH